MKKICNKCKIELPLSDFGTQKGGKYGLNGRCKKCIREIQSENYSKDPLRFKETTRKYHEKNPFAKTETRLKHVYGISLLDYNTLLKEQDNKCAICKTDASLFNRLLDVDHCHTTNVIRGLLCPNCNKSLGLLKEDINILKNAIKYLTHANFK